MQKAKPILCVRVQCRGVSWQNLGKLWLALQVEKQYTKNRSTLPGSHSKSKADLEIEGLHNQVPVCVLHYLCVLKREGEGVQQCDFKLSSRFLHHPFTSFQVTTNIYK